MAGTNFRDSEVDRLHDEVEERQEQKKKASSGMSQRTKVGLGLLGGLGVWYYLNTSGDNNLLLLGGIVVAIALIANSGGPDNQVLDEQEAKARMFKHLKFKQQEPYGSNFEIPPNASIEPLPVGRLRHIEGEPWKYELGFSVQKQDGLMTKYTADVDPYTGKVTGIIERPGGFTGDESVDIRWIESPKLRKENRYRQAGGSTGRRRDREGDR